MAACVGALVVREVALYARCGHIFSQTPFMMEDVLLCSDVMLKVWFTLHVLRLSLESGGRICRAPQLYAGLTELRPQTRGGSSLPLYTLTQHTARFTFKALGSRYP